MLILDDIITLDISSFLISHPFRWFFYEVVLWQRMNMLCYMCKFILLFIANVRWRDQFKQYSSAMGVARETARLKQHISILSAKHF